MYKVILHVGLSKTATTALQNNFFLKLHQQGKINFLGRAFTCTQKKYFNPFGDIMSELRTQPLDLDREIVLRRRFHAMLTDERVNVISEESLTVTSDQSHELIYENLKRLMEGCQVKVLIGLRNPVDFFYSAYIEMHRWTYHRVKTKDTITKFLDAVCLDPDSPEYDMFFFDRMIAKLKLRFPDIQIYLFEEFRFDKSSLLEILHEYFELEIHEMMFINDMGAENTRIYFDKGKKGEAVTLNQKIPHFINKVFKKDIRVKLKRQVFIRMAYHTVLRLTDKVKVTPIPEHPKLTGEQCEKLLAAIDLDINYLVSEFNLDAGKLKAYGYADYSDL